MVFQGELVISTRGHGDIHEIGAEVQQIVTRSGIKKGLVQVFNVGSTAAVGTIECEPGLEHDLPVLLNRLIPPGRSYGHEQTWHDGNAHSHLQATMLGPSLTVPIRQGRLVLGTWQQIFHIECDIKTRQREVVVTVTGE
jgi:secondary thiamine-phosphate synthase enzyme